MNNINLMDEKELVDREAAYNLGFIPKQGMPTDLDTQVARLQDYMVSDRDADAAERVRQYYGEALPIKDISQDAMEYFVGAAFARQHGISGAPESYWLGQKLDMPEVESREDLYGLMGRDLMERTRKGWEEQQKLVQERQAAMTGLLKDMVTASDAEGRAALQERFSEAFDRGVFSEADWTSVQNARDAFETLQKDITKDFETAGANVLTKSFEGEYIFDKLYGDTMAQALFLTALQERVQDLKTDVQERAVYEKAAKVFAAAGKELAARVAGGHFKEYVTDEQVEEFNAELPLIRERARKAAMYGGKGASDRAAISGFAIEDEKFEKYYNAAKASGQLNADGTLRKMTKAEWKRTGELNAFRGELYKSISGAYDVDGVVAGLAKMMPDSLVYLVPGGQLLGVGSGRTRNLAMSLAEGEDYVSAEVKANVDAAIQAQVEKLAFGSVGVTRWAPGMDWLMSRKVVGGALGKIYGTTAGRIGMGVLAGSAEETFAEPLASLIMRGAYNAVALEEFQLDDPLGEYQAEMEEMLQPEQLLVTALYGLLLGGVNVTGHRQAAADYREVYKELVAAGVDEGRAAQAARDDAAVASFKATKRLFEETLKEKPASVLGYLAEVYPQLQGMATMEAFFSKMDLPRLIPAENGQVKVQTRDAEGNVTELVMGKESAQLLVQAKLEEMTAKEMAQFADAALANAMVGAMSKKSDKWDIEVVAEKMDHEYFERLANAAGVRTHGKAWQERMLVARHDYEEKHGKVTDEEWAKIQDKLVSRVNRTGLRGADGRLRTLFRVARGGFGAMEVLEDITEDNLVRDMEANGRTLDYYVKNLQELEGVLGKQGAFLRELKNGETEYDRMAVVEAMGKLVQSKVLADTAKNSNMFSAALNAFLDMIRSWVLQAKAMMKLGAAVNKVLTDAEAAKTLDEEFVADVERLAQQDIEFLRELQLEDGLAAMQRVLEARKEAKADKGVKSRRKKADTPVMDEAERNHGKDVRAAAQKKAEVQAKVEADVAVAEAALEGDEGSMSVSEEDFQKEMAQHFQENSTPPDGWWVHGRNGMDVLRNDHVIQMTRNNNVGLQYGSNGSIWYIRPKKEASVIDTNNEIDAERLRAFVEEKLDDPDSYIYSDFYRLEENSDSSFEEDVEKVLSLFIPENIVDSAGAYDNPQWVLELWDSLEVDFVITPDGAIAINPESIEAVRVDTVDQSSSMSVTDAQERGLFEDGVLEASNAVVTAPSFSLDALHATPHRFRKFDTSKMGTGEGAQAFGWGLYFAGNVATAKSYYDDFERGNRAILQGDKQIASADVLEKIARELSDAGLSKEESKMYATGAVRRLMGGADLAQLVDKLDANKKDFPSHEKSIEYQIKALRIILGLGLSTAAPSVYRVELNADDSNLLMWDDKVPAELHEAVRELRSGQPGKGLVISMPNASEMTWPGYRIYSELTNALGSAKAASEWLAERGYKGIKYLDGMSRRAGEGTYNYVIFSGDDVKITGVNETGRYDAPWEDYEDETASFSVVGEGSANWAEIKDRAFRGRDDGKLRVELDSSQAKLRKVKRHAMDDSVADELLSRVEWFAAQVRAAGRWEDTLDAWKKGYWGYTVRELAFLSRVLKAVGLEFASFKAMEKAGVFELVMNPGEEKAKQVLKKRKVKNVLGYNKLGEVLDFPAVYEAYPELKEVPVYWMNDKFQYRAAYTVSGEHRRQRISARANRAEGGILSSLLHEVQHWIQAKEGFAWGAVPGDDDSYERSAGEIEARNVQRRRWMDAEERAMLPFNETLLYPGEARVVTLEEAMASMSVVNPTVAEYRDNTIEFNVVSAMDDDARAWQRDKMAKAGLTEDEIEGYFALLDGMVSEVLDASKDSPEFKAWQEMAVQRWVKGGVVTPTVSAFKKNGDYPVNIDLGTICVKREMMTLLTDKLVSEGYADRLGVSQIEQLKDLMKEAGIATACDICFVEARRIRALSQAQQLSFFWNAVRAAAGIEGHEPIGKHGELTAEQVAKLEKMADPQTRDAALLELVDDMYRRNGNLDKGLSPKTMSIIATSFLQDASLAGEAVLGDFMSVKRVDFMLRGYPHTQVRLLLASAFGPSTAKPVEGFNVYDALSWRQDFNDNALEEMREKLYNIGGGRVQSFTDFNPVLFMDYYQMVFDFAWRGLPLQAYTKVPEFVALFGQTGIKINMSLVPAVVDGVPDEYVGMQMGADGNWELAWHKDSFPVELAYKYRKDARMHQNVGTIAVGISREHVRTLLRDERIDYVIPYHRSGMPVATQIKTGLDKATDFTDVQNTRKPGVKAYKDAWKFNETLRKLGDPKAAAQAYLEYCDKNGLIPKFDEFRNEENYYKLLLDFRVYDKDGAYAPQGPVTTQMPENWRKVLEKALGSRAKTVERMEEILDNEAFMERVRGIMQQIPLEGEVRNLMVKRLTQALKTKAVTEPVKCLSAADFDKKVYEVCHQTLQQDEAAKMSEVLRLHNGIIYGFTQGGVLYLKENTFNANTPAHEFTHVWAKVAQMANPKLWAKGVELLKKTAHWGDVMTDPLYFNIHGNEDAVASEVLARMAGNMSERMVRELTDPAKKQLTEKGLVAQIAEWVKDIWKSVRSLFDKVDGKLLTLDEFSKMPLCDLWVPTRNRKFNAYVKKYLSKSVDEQRAEIQALAEDFSASMVNLDEEVVAAEVVAAGQGFKANLAYSDAIMREMRGAMQRLRKLSGKTRTDREDAVAAMGTMVQMVKAAVAYLPKGYRFSVHPYLNRIEALAELAATGDIDLTSDIASKDILELENAEGVDLKKPYDEMVKEYGNVKLAEALERIMHRVSEQLRKHAKDRAVEKITELVERLAPKKDPKTGKLKGGKMSADAYRDLATVDEAMKMNAEQLEAKLAALKADMAKSGISEALREQLEDKIMLYDQFGDPASMTAEDAVAAYEALRVRIYFHRFEWDDKQARIRGARRAVVRRVVDGVGSVSENEYNAKKRRVKPVKRLKNLGDILSGMPAALSGMRGYLPLRQMADELALRTNAAGEAIKAWEAERWLALEALSKETMGKSWRECMDFMHKVQPTGVSFDRPKFRTVNVETEELRELLEMTKEERKAEMKRRREAGGLEAERALSERDVQELQKKLEAMEEEDRVLSRVETRYLVEVQHEENLQLSRGEALYAILMFEQPTYTERLIMQGYTFEVIEGLREYVGDGMLQFGYGLRELFAQQGDRIAAVYEEAFGVPFPREENYFAARWVVNGMKENPAEQLLAGMSGTAGAGNGWMKQRVNHNLELDMTKDALQVFLQATSLTDTWMATQDIVADFKAWTRDADFERALTAVLGKESYDNLKDWIRILEQGGVQDCLNMGVSQDVINGLYGSGAVAILGLRIQTLLKQTPAIFNGLLGAHDISAAEWFATMSRMKNGDAPMTYKRMVNSTLMKMRQQGKAGNMAGQAVRSGDTASSAAEGLLMASMLPMEWVDARCTAIGLVPVWNVYYQRAVDQGASAQEAEQAAWEQTALVANLASQPIGWLNKIKIAQSRNPIVKSAFYMLSENTAKFALCRALWRGGKKMAAFRAWLVYGAANAAISAMLDALQGDPEEFEKGKWWEYVFSAFYGPASGIPGVGEALESAVNALLNLTGEVADIDWMKKMKTRASAGRALVDFQGSWKAMERIYGFMTDNDEHSLAEYTRAASTVSRTLAIGTGWLGNMVGYWSMAVAVLMNPIDFGARVYRNMKHYYGEE